jgi:D-sedoheptulose 7-phosphate isomerase
MRKSYSDLSAALEGIEVEDHGYGSVAGYLQMVRDTAGPYGAKLIFIGNGGSAAIASHMAADFQKNGGMKSMCFNDAASLTCISNDIGYHDVFRLPLQKHATVGDVLFAISSSGDSQNIVNAVEWAAKSHLNVVTLSGFRANNKIRGKGGVNFYVPSSSYGIIEIAHLAILHSLLDEVMHNGD